MASGSTPSNIQRVLLNQIRTRVGQLTNRLGVHTSNYLRAAGFIYTGNGDTTRCVDCGLEISDWTRDMVPFTIHAQRSPRCPFVNDVRTPLTVPSTVVPNAIGSAPMGRETTPVHEIAASTNSNSSSNNFAESEQLKQTRERSFSHWPNRTRPSAEQMIDAGFFYCNEGDRVICIYCNLLCQGWVADTYDPYVVHENLSPGCCYVKAFFTSYGSPSIINDNSRLTISLVGIPPLVSNNINLLVANGLIRLTTQINSSQTDRMESIDDDDAIQANIQSSPVWTKEMITRMVAARLDWPASHELLNRYSLWIIRKCWEDQLRLKGVDFVSDLDLKVACLIRQKQVEHVRAQKPMIIPHERMRQVRENEIRALEEILEEIRVTVNSTIAQDQPPDLEPSERCVVCLSLKKHVAFLPCGHLVTCVLCSDRTDTCPVCRGPKTAVALILT